MERMGVYISRTLSLNHISSHYSQSGALPKHLREGIEPHSVRRSCEGLKSGAE